MNATSLYVSTCRLVLQADVDDSSSWTDLYRLFPYLRQSLSCTVCGQLLIEPYTPTESDCQHHVCRSCKGGKRNLKPSCSWCKDDEKFIENVQLRILLQCYKKLCLYITSTAIFRKLATPMSANTANNNNGSIAIYPFLSLIDLIKEGSGFVDEFKVASGLSKSTYSILPLVNSASTQTQSNILCSGSALHSDAINYIVNPEINLEKNNSATNGLSPLYSVMYGSGNKLTIKRKASELETEQDVISTIAADLPRATTTTNCGSAGFKKPSSGRSSSAATVKHGCKCGNATQFPGKLTCCGQRCPCYTDNKACSECKCRGCRNPHAADGSKVLPAVAHRYHEVKLEEGETNEVQATNMPALNNSTVQVVGIYTAEMPTLVLCNTGASDGDKNDTEAEV